MSDQFDEYEDDENDGEETQEQPQGDGPKALRNQLRKLQKQIREQEQELAGYRRQSRSAKVASLLPEGFPKAAAKFYDSEDVSKEAVEAWVAENADAFGYSPQETDEGADQQQREAAAAQAAMHKATGPNGTVGASAAGAGDPQVGSPEEMLALLRDPNVSTEDLVQRGLLKLDGSLTQAQAS